MSTEPWSAVSILDIGAAACVACCAGTILAILGVGLTGLASTVIVGAAGLTVTAIAATGVVFVRRRLAGVALRLRNPW